jgi:glycosyltransferase involved in cell wall biosynthesis
MALSNKSVAPSKPTAYRSRSIVSVSVGSGANQELISDGSLPPGLSVVVPVYNSQSTLPSLVSRLSALAEVSDTPFEAIFVNDGSSDDSWQVIEEFCGLRTWLHAIDLMQNSGQENALLCGIRAARYATIATIDDDLQNPPEEIPRLVNALDGGFDVVYGKPARERHGLWRDAASIATKFIMHRLLGVRHARDVTAFKVFRTELRYAFDSYQSPYVSIDLLLTWGTSRIGVITVRHDARAVGSSNFTLRKLVSHAINLMTGFSVVPLRLASVTGFVFSLLGFGALVYVLLDYLIRGDPVPGFPFLAGVIGIFSGAQMFALGIIGEYLARIHLRSLGRPPYAVRRTLLRC